jgi:hypothetical protein
MIAPQRHGVWNPRGEGKRPLRRDLTNLYCLLSRFHQCLAPCCDLVTAIASHVYITLQSINTPLTRFFYEGTLP